MKRIFVFFLGGTIAMRSGRAGACPAQSPESIVEDIALREPAMVMTEVVMNAPSGHIVMRDVYALARRAATARAAGADGIVVVQGTDTIEETAFALDLMHNGPEPVVVTGAMRPASATSPDGPGNVRDAIHIAMDAGAQRRGVVVALNGVIHAGRQATKSHTTRLEAFVSRDNGPLGLIAEDSVAWHGPAPGRAVLDVPPHAAKKVALVKSYLGDEGQLVAAMDAAGIDGLVFEGLGGGHAHPAAADCLERLAAKVPVVLATRCGGGPVLTASYGYIGGDMDLIRRGLIPCGTLSGVKARMALAMLLDNGKTQADVRAFFHVGPPS